MPKRTARPERIIKGTGPKKLPPRPDYGGKPPGASPNPPKPKQSADGYS